MTAPTPIPATDTPQPYRGAFSLLVDRPILTLMIVVAMLVVGSVSLFRLPLTFMGEGMTWGNINVWVPINESRSPQETEDKLSRPTEELLRTIPGIRQLSIDSSQGGARIRIELDSDLDPTLASAEVRDRLHRAMLAWPEGVDRYFTWREDGSSPPLQFLQILTPAFTAEWQEKVENTVVPRLEAVDGVGRVEIFGLHSEAVRIWFDRDKLAAHRIDYRDLLRRIGDSNSSDPAGELEGGSERIVLRIDGRFTSLQDIEEFPIRPGLKVRDVARVHRDRRESNQNSRFNRRYTFTGSIRATSGANPVDTSVRVRAAAEALKSEPGLEGLDFRYMFDQGEFIRSSLDNLFSASSFGALLALGVLLLFLRNLRAALAIGAAIPLTLLVVADYLYFTRDSLNILTMTGMTLAVGMVVDNSVVVLENIRRLRDRGLSHRDACVEGAREMGLAVSLATLTTVVVFVPVIFMGTSGQMRAMFGSVGIPLSIALLSSLFVALLLLPSGILRLGGLGGLGGPDPAATPATARQRWSPVELLTTGTLSGLDRGLRHRYPLLGVLAVLLGLLATGLLPSPLPSLEFESGDKNPFRASDVSIRLSMPHGMSDADVLRQVEEYEDLLLGKQDEWRIQNVSARFSRTSINLDVHLDESVPRPEYADYARRIRSGIPRVPGIKMVVGSSGQGGAEEQDQRNFVVRIQGRDSEHLARLGREVETMLGSRPEVETVEVSALDDNRELIVDVDRDRLQDLAVSPEVLFGTLTGGLQGRDITRYEEEGRDIRVVAQFARSEDPSLADLRETTVFSARGNFQRVSDVTEISFRNTLDRIQRLDGKTTVTVVGRRAEGVGPRAFSQQLARWMQVIPLPRGYTWSEDSMSRQTAAQIDELLGAGLLSVVLVFLLMGILFESVILPSAILVTIVIAVFGGMWALKLFHGSIDPMAITGLILLAGVVVNNGIVLLDCIERLRRDGIARADAIREGIRIRLRPIVMTAATTIVGLLPMALWGETSGQGINYVSLSITVVGGLALCTLLTAPAVAITYTWLDDLSHWLVGAMHAGLASPRDTDTDTDTDIDTDIYRRAQRDSSANPQSL